MPPVLRSATETQSAKVAGVVDTTDSSRPGKGGDQQDIASERDEPSYLSSNTTPNDQTPTGKSNEGSAQAVDPESSHRVSEIPVAALPGKTLSAKNRIKLKRAAQAKYARRWDSLLSMEFDTSEANEWLASFKIDVLDKLECGRDEESQKGESDKDGHDTSEERKKRKEMIVTRYLEKWEAMLGQGFDYPECEERYREFEDWMKGMEEVFDELMN